MGGIVIFSDLQAHAWQEADRSDRWKDCATAIREAYKTAHWRNAELIIFNGDLFESKRTVRSDIAGAILETFGECAQQAKKNHIRSIFNAGNHDYHNGECILRALSPFGTVVVDQPYTVPTITVGRLLVVPYAATRNKKTLHTFMSDRYNVAVIHADVDGARVTPTYKTPDGAADLPAEFFLQHNSKRYKRRFVFNGHYHHRQIIRKKGMVPIVCYGACMYHDWSDLDDHSGRGCVWVHADAGEVDFEYTDFRQLPRFVSNPAAARPGIDFVLPRSETAEAIETTVHDNVDAVASFDRAESVRAYVGERVGSLSTQERKRLEAQGIDLWAGKEKERKP